ncbi:YihY family inner membrane protein [Oxalobacteraceae bacterium CAVE-383]|nr:YihY family inner membrane protein [Oxalobacteraceae bacterium CAVE-383]
MVSKLRTLSLHDLRELFRFAARRLEEERLPQVAGALTFTSILALVPMATIAFALFTAFPLFSTFRASLEAYFIQNLMPANMANTILGYINQFASKSARLSAVGGVALIFTSGMTMATIDHTFNRIWRVQTSRPLLQRILVYWAIITLGPLLIGVSISATSYVGATTSGVLGSAPILGSGFYTVCSILLTTSAFTLLYITVPNQVVDWQDAIWGGLLAGIAFEIAKRLFTAYVIKFPTYTMIYGAVAALPIFLLWVYMLWMITLVGALLTAVLPVMRYERWRHKPTPCGTFVDALAILRVLYRARGSERLTVDVDQVRRRTHIGYEESQLLMERMQNAGWLGVVKAAEAPKRFRWGRHDDAHDRWALLANPSLLTLADVYRRFVFDAETPRDRELLVVQQISAAIDAALNRSLAAYFDDVSISAPAADAALQKQLMVAEPRTAS